LGGRRARHACDKGPFARGAASIYVRDRLA